MHRAASGEVSDVTTGRVTNFVENSKHNARPGDDSSELITHDGIYAANRAQSSEWSTRNNTFFLSRRF